MPRVSEVYARKINRFFSRISLKDDCWKWNGEITWSGYGRFTLNKKRWLCHRLSYEYFIERIPTGLVTDHLCRNRWCLNPFHIEPVSNRENILRGNGQCAKNAKKTLCKRGHKLSKVGPDNKSPRRICRTCVKAYNRALYLRMTSG